MTPTEALVSVWREFSHADDFPFSPDHCINGTRVAVEVLRRFGVTAQPMSVRMVVFNSFAWDLFTHGVPISEWPAHAWSVGVGPGMDTQPGRWNGHLVAVGEDFMLDMSAGQFHRPGKIDMPGPLLIDGALAPDDQSLMVTGPKGLKVLYAPWPEANEWRTASGWRLERNAAVIRHVTNLVGTVLTTTASERN